MIITKIIVRVLTTYTIILLLLFIKKNNNNRNNSNKSDTRHSRTRISVFWRICDGFIYRKHFEIFEILLVHR